ncbi:hypothetical protein PoB_005613300 [Plakobranchus ocellatus]|uniref:Uncharacterized protein n=1 Tax=Plakobranchus ocellatus TaxID=259542 RepID=A0AAV4CDW3_9GAST|nr:hypothetical protein PoB_005613300 [Plakobranchus ocellatus]
MKRAGKRRKGERLTRHPFPRSRWKVLHEEGRKKEKRRKTNETSLPQIKTKPVHNRVISSFQLLGPPSGLGVGGRARTLPLKSPCRSQGRFSTHCATTTRITGATTITLSELPT